jgi:hypothetical protein
MDAIAVESREDEEPSLRGVEAPDKLDGSATLTVGTQPWDVACEAVFGGSGGIPLWGRWEAGVTVAVEEAVGMVGACS